MGGEQAVFPVEPTEIRNRYQGFVNTIQEREKELSKDFPVKKSYGVHKPLHNISQRWEDGEKSLRTTPVLNVYSTCTDPHRVVKAEPVLIGLDANINVLDDIIDTRVLTNQDKIDLTITTAFSNTYAFGNIPPEHLPEIIGLYYDYLIRLFQIPLVEQQLLKRFEQSESRADRLKIAEEIYRYRALDITVFAEIPSQILDVDQCRSDKMISDLENYRARRLLFKDLADVKRDIHDQDQTVVLSLLHEYEDPLWIEEFMVDVVEAFSYSESGENLYGDILHRLENRPKNLANAIEKQIQAARELSV